MKLIRQLICVSTLCLSIGIVAHAQTINWKGYTWNVDSGAMAGVINCDPANVVIDANGYLEESYSVIGGKMTGAEVYCTTAEPFGSYYWVESGPLNNEKQDVISGFTYGPALGYGVDGENEIDVEFSWWAGSYIDFDFAVYPATGYSGQSGQYEKNITFPSTVTCRIDWSSTQVTESIWSGVVPPTAATSTALVTWTYDGTVQQIPQSLMPMAFNMWGYRKAPTVPVTTKFMDYQYAAGGFGSGGNTAPAAPTGLTSTGGNAQVALSWTPSTGATSYNVYRGTTAGGESTTAIATGVTGPSYTDAGVVNGTTYYYKVAAVNAIGTSPLSSETSATPAVPVLPAAPSNLTATTSGATAINLAWTDNATNATGYYVYRSTSSGGTYTLDATLGSTAVSYSDTGLKRNTTYYYEVSAYNAAGSSADSNIASARS